MCRLLYLDGVVAQRLRSLFMFDVSAVRSHFPALRRTIAGVPAVYVDGPGGTQVPDVVIEAIAGHLGSGTANLGGTFATSVETNEIVASARSAISDLFNAAPAEIAFGQNMTSLTLAISRAIGARWAKGDNVVVTRLDHDANIWPWVLAARDAGAEVRWADFDPERGCALHPDTIADIVDDRTKLVAVTHASNAVGTIVDVGAVTEIAHSVGALSYVDAVHYTPHGPVDVKASGCDFLVASAYKFFGPHVGCMFGREDLLEHIDAYKIRPAPDEPPEKWETGTQSFEALAGAGAAVDYIASLGDGASRRDRIESAMEGIAAHEQRLIARFLAGLAEMPGVRFYGVDGTQGRTPTFAVDVVGRDPAGVAAELAEKGIFVWVGHYYALEVMQRLGKAAGGLIRIGFVHYNTVDEVDRVLAALEAALP